MLTKKIGNYDNLYMLTHGQKYTNTRCLHDIIAILQQVILAEYQPYLTDI